LLGGDHGVAPFDGGALLSIQVLLEARIHGREQPESIGGTP
jgi:hypothetical protein